MRLSRVCFLKRSIDDLLLKSKCILKKREKFFGKIQFYKVQLADLYKMCIMKTINSSKKNSFILKQMTGQRKVQKEGEHMLQATEFLRLMRFITKSHEACIQTICREHQLTMMEATIITFLRNNPSVDTAADIAELRMLSKGQVSQAVESLVQKGLVTRQPDASDRRRIHLLLCEKSIPVTDSIDAIQRQFLAGIFDGFSEKEMECFAGFHERIMENVRRLSEKMVTVQ